MFLMILKIDPELRQLKKICLRLDLLGLFLVCNQSRDMADNVNHPRRLNPTIESITYSFVLYLQHGRHDVKYKQPIPHPG